MSSFEASCLLAESAKDQTHPCKNRKDGPPATDNVFVGQGGFTDFILNQEGPKFFKK
jgi:hypothetical protein